MAVSRSAVNVPDSQIFTNAITVSNVTRGALTLWIAVRSSVSSSYQCKNALKCVFGILDIVEIHSMMPVFRNIVGYGWFLNKILRAPLTEIHVMLPKVWDSTLTLFQPIYLSISLFPYHP